MNTMNKKSDEPDCPLAASSIGDDGAGHYAAYEEHTKTLRTWLVAYGIGAPVLILSQDQVWKQLAMTGLLPCIASLFLIGVVLQVVLAALNKSAMWACYNVTINKDFENTRAYRLGAKVAGLYWIDLVCDLSSMILFGIATYLCFLALMPK